MDQTALKAVIIGGSGNVGKELINQICASSKWSEIVVIARKRLQEWDSIQGKEKIKFIETSTLDTLEDASNWKQLAGYNSFFCCLGTSSQKQGEAAFIKVDYTYCLWGGQVAKACQIPHFAIVTTQASNKKSFMLYYRTKGLVEEALTNLQLPHLSIFRPGGIIRETENPTFIQTLYRNLPFFPTIQIQKLARALMLQAEEVHNQKLYGTQVTAYNNKDILNYLKL